MAFCKKCGYLRGSKSSCQFYKEDYCNPCRFPKKYYDCELVKIGNQKIIDNWKPSEPNGTDDSKTYHEDI